MPKKYVILRKKKGDAGMKLFILFFVFAICVYGGKKLGEKQSGFMGDFVFWFIAAPVYTTIIMHITYFFLYGWNKGMLFMFAPLLLPIGMGIFSLAKEWNYRWVYKKHTPFIKSLSLDLLPKAKKITVMASYTSERIFDFLPHTPKKLDVTVHIFVPKEIMNEIDEARWEEAIKIVEKTLEQKFASATSRVNVR